MLPRHVQSRTLSLPLAAACAMIAGCAGLPRIDPTGERLLIFPDNQVQPVAVAPAVSGNLQAPPVGTDPFFPQPQLAAAPAIAPAGVAPMVTPVSAAFPQTPQDKLSITPQRVLAPIGSEVVLKASICATNGYTLSDQKVEWMLGRNGVGQFVEVGGKGLFHPPLLPWARGSKVDNYLANGYTAASPLCITRGTADQTDDVNINAGDAWISVTSPNEGVSHVTAYTPAVESWDQRKASATIYWVDVQWQFPPPVVASSGRGEMLTTVVNRQTDGTPIEGWIVRYVVADGGEPRDMLTGPDGRASVQVTPTASGAASSQVAVELIRPANFGGGDAPRLIVGSGTTLVNWGSGSPPYLPPSSGPSPAVPPIQTSPAQPIPQTPITPQPQLPAASQSPARLELEIQNPPQAQVGGSALFKVSIRNLGDAPATQVVLTDAFDPGLIFPKDPKSDKIAYNVGTIGPRETRQIDLPFQVSKGGSLCHTVSIAYAEGNPITKQSCITASEAPPQREARVEVKMEGDLQRVVGETAIFKVTVKNIGQTPLVNIVVEEEYPPAVLQPQPTRPGVQVISGKITSRIARLEVGQQQQWDTPCLCRQSTRVTPLVRVTAETDPPGQRIPTNAEHTLEILLPGAAPPAGADPTTPGSQGTPGTPAAGPLGVRVSFVAPTAVVGGRMTCEVVVENRTNAPQEQVALRVLFPPNLTPDAVNAEGPPGVQPQVNGDQLVFPPIAVLAAGERVLYRIPLNPTQIGIVNVTAQAVSRSVPRGVDHTEKLEIIGGDRR